MLHEILMRDPFIFVDKDTYYLFGTTSLPVPSSSEPYGDLQEASVTFSCYTSQDLETWRGPFCAFKPPDNFFGFDTSFWAPEVVQWIDGSYLLVGTFKRGGSGGRRGIVILSSHDGPRGPYKVPRNSAPVTPESWQCLDGHLFVEDPKAPYLVFCREFLQVRVGQICALPLDPGSLAARAGAEATVLFHANEAPWAAPISRRAGEFITDGPFLFRSALTGELLMLWSSMGTVRADSGTSPIDGASSSNTAWEIGSSSAAGAAAMAALALEDDDEEGAARKASLGAVEVMADDEDEEKADIGEVVGVVVAEEEEEKDREEKRHSSSALASSFIFDTLDAPLPQPQTAVSAKPTPPSRGGGEKGTNKGKSARKGASKPDRTIYQIGVARTAPGAGVLGPWTHDPEPIWEHDGGHAMLFRAPHLGSKLMITFHSPNFRIWDSRPQVLPVEETVDERGRAVLRVMSL